jgi:HAD superfamily hydrolase (TIGR01459 family)
MQNISGLEEIAARYDAFVFDVWGTLHNGEQTFPGAVSALQNLKAMGKRSTLLSNSPSRAANLARGLAQSYGITPDLYHTLMNSGESSYLALRDRDDDFHSRLGRNYFFIQAANHRGNYDDLPYHEVTDIAEADFIILSKTLDYDETVEDFEGLLNDAVSRQLPMVCTNPDKVAGVGDTLFICPGTVAAFYETMGGQVYYHGKPHSRVYQLLDHALGDLDPRRILAIGDAFETDILGGNRFGCDTLLLTGGIHSVEINRDAPTADLERLVRQYDACPSYVMDELRW